MALRIRPATFADADAVEHLLNASYRELLAAWYPPSLLARALPRMTRPNPRLLRCGTWYVAIDSRGRLAGCGGWTPQRPGTEETEPGVAHLRHFGTHPRSVRTGVGRSLAQHCFRNADDAGIRRFECWSTDAAEAFYASLGFRRVNRIEVPMGPGVALPSWLMRFGF